MIKRISVVFLRKKIVGLKIRTREKLVRCVQKSTHSNEGNREREREREREILPLQKQAKRKSTKKKKWKKKNSKDKEKNVYYMIQKTKTRKKKEIHWKLRWHAGTLKVQSGTQSNSLLKDSERKHTKYRCLSCLRRSEKGRLEARNRGKENETGCSFSSRFAHSQEYLNRQGANFN